MAKKKRADILMVEQGLAPSRTKAQALILAGKLLGPNGEHIKKAGDSLFEDTELRLQGKSLDYVSRGGLKLEAPLDEFNIDVTHQTCLDIGASTGGFTDCLLQRGAEKVFAVDVGYGQMAWSLRQDPRVVVIERENIRTIDAALIPEPCSVVVIDVSFISLTLVIPPSLRFVEEGAVYICLVKPQFEVGRENVGKGGIVRDDVARNGALEKIKSHMKEMGFVDLHQMDSPITGAKGNKEFLLSAQWSGKSVAANKS